MKVHKHDGEHGQNVIEEDDEVCLKAGTRKTKQKRKKKRRRTYTYIFIHIHTHICISWFVSTSLSASKQLKRGALEKPAARGSSLSRPVRAYTSRLGFLSRWEKTRGAGPHGRAKHLLSNAQWISMGKVRLGILFWLTLNGNPPQKKVKKGHHYWATGCLSMCLDQNFIFKHQLWRPSAGWFLLGGQPPGGLVPRSTPKLDPKAFGLQARETQASDASTLNLELATGKVERARPVSLSNNARMPCF